MTRRKKRGTSPVVSINPPQCPFCKKTGCIKLGGAFNVINQPHLGSEMRFYRVRCKSCDERYVLRERIIVSTDSVLSSINSSEI